MIITEASSEHFVRCGVQAMSSKLISEDDELKRDSEPMVTQSEALTWRTKYGTYLQMRVLY